VKLEQQDRATVAMIGRPKTGTQEYQFAYTFARELLNRGKIVRTGTRGPLVNAVLDAANYVTSLYQDVFEQLQAVLFVPPGEKLLSKEVKSFSTIVARTTLPSIKFGFKTCGSLYFLSRNNGHAQPAFSI